MSETKIVLGWLLDLQKFVIKLPTDKAQAWLLDLDEMIERTKNNKPVTEKELESLIGKLDHASHIIWEGRYFLS